MHWVILKYLSETPKESRIGSGCLMYKFTSIWSAKRLKPVCPCGLFQSKEGLRILKSTVSRGPIKQWTIISKTLQKWGQESGWWLRRLSTVSDSSIPARQSQGKHSRHWDSMPRTWWLASLKAPNTRNYKVISKVKGRRRTSRCILSNQSIFLFPGRPKNLNMSSSSFHMI